MNFENNLKGADKYQISEPKCRICGNSKGNKIFTAKERQFGTLEEFNYFTCSSCGCIQILEFPKNPGKYYPADYYAYDQPVFPTKLTGIIAYLKKASFDTTLDTSIFQDSYSPLYINTLSRGSEKKKLTLTPEYLMLGVDRAENFFHFTEADSEI
ncbi:MAG: hypothetical protein WBJ37_02380 [Bacteroidales bacterium]